MDLGTIHSINQGSPVKPICFISHPLSHLKGLPVWTPGVMLESMYDLQKHIHKWCPCNEDTDNEDEPPRKKRRFPFNEDDNEPQRKKPRKMDEEDEDDVFYILMNKAKEKNDDKYLEKVKFFVNQGLNEEEAKHHATDVMASYDKKMFLDLYKQILRDVLGLKGDHIHEQIMHLAQSLRNEMSDEDAIKTAVKRFKHLFDFEELLNSDDEDEEDQEDDEKEDDEKEDDEQKEEHDESDDDDEADDDQKEDNTDDDDDSEHDDDDPKIRAKVLKEIKEKLRGKYS